VRRTSQIVSRGVGLFAVAVLGLLGTPQLSLAQSPIKLAPPPPGAWQLISASTLGHSSPLDKQLSLPTQVGQRLNAFREHTPDYRWAGLGIGAGVGAVVFGIIGHGTCDDGGSCVGPTLGIGLLGAVAGGVAGGLLGSLIPKHEDHADAGAPGAGG
jgi:hypothetical protein